MSGIPDIRWISPDGRPLQADRPWSLSDGRRRWPVVDGIPYLRADRPELAQAALAALDNGDRIGALSMLLQDQDEWARTPPPRPEVTRDVARGVGHGSLSLRDAMEALSFGPVAHYFAHRWSAPTFLSALGLLERHWTKPPLLVEVACGIGQVLREAALRGTAVAGVDVVFAKLWLARHYVAPEAALACADISLGMPLAPVEGAAVLCHDAFYFLPGQERVADTLMTFAGAKGAVLVGHAHNRLADQGGVAGRPRTPAEYAALFPGAVLYDDAALAGDSAQPRSAEALAGAEAVSLAWRRNGWTAAPLAPVDFRLPPPGTPLRPNPLLVEEGGRLRPRWPTPAFAKEYAAATYLEVDAPSPALLARAAAGAVGSDPAVDALARRRVLLHLPERW